MVRQVGSCGRKRRRCCNGADRGSNFAPTRKGANLRPVSQDEKPYKPYLLMSSLELQAAHPISVPRWKVTAKSYRYGLTTAPLTERL
jgi:hypothetical protein